MSRMLWGILTTGTKAARQRPIVALVGTTRRNSVGDYPGGTDCQEVDRGITSDQVFSSLLRSAQVYSKSRVTRQDDRFWRFPAGSPKRRSAFVTVGADPPSSCESTAVTLVASYTTCITQFLFCRHPCYGWCGVSVSLLGHGSGRSRQVSLFPQRPVWFQPER